MSERTGKFSKGMTRPGAAYFESGAATQRVQLSLMDHVTGHNDNQRTKGRMVAAAHYTRRISSQSTHHHQRILK